MNPGTKKGKKLHGKAAAEENEPAVLKVVPAAEEEHNEKAAETAEASGELAALEDKLLRLRAEYANYKRRSEKEKTELAALIKAEVYRGIIPIIDDFERLSRHLAEVRDSLDSDLVKGIEMIRSSLAGSLKKQGVEAIEGSGVQFDPYFHEAMLTEPVEKKKDDHTVRQVLEVGYRLGDLVIRPAKVKVGIYGG